MLQSIFISLFMHTFQLSLFELLWRVSLLAFLTSTFVLKLNIGNLTAFSF